MSSTETAPPLALGTPVTFGIRLKRRAFGKWDAPRKAWISVNPPEGQRAGIVVGMRTLSDGTTSYNGEDGTEYQPTRHFRAYLVAYDLNRSPVHVLPEDLTPTPKVPGQDEPSATTTTGAHK